MYYPGGASAKPNVSQEARQPSALWDVGCKSSPVHQQCCQISEAEEQAFPWQASMDHERYVSHALHPWYWFSNSLVGSLLFILSAT